VAENSSEVKEEKGPHPGRAGSKKRTPSRFWVAAGAGASPRRARRGGGGTQKPGGKKLFGRGDTLRVMRNQPHRSKGSPEGDHRHPGDLIREEGGNQPVLDKESFLLERRRVRSRDRGEKN